MSDSLKVKRCGTSSTYRQRLERIKTNCQLIRQRRRKNFPIKLHENVFQQRTYQIGSLESIRLNSEQWATSNFLRLSDEYLYKCKYAMFASTCRSYKQNEFYKFLKEFYSCAVNSTEGIHQCQLCENKFHSNEMFDLHLQRESVSINYRCLVCRLRVETTNPCQAYSHLLKHKNLPEEKRIDQLTINSNWQQYSVC